MGNSMIHIRQAIDRAQALELRQLARAARLKISGEFDSKDYLSFAVKAFKHLEKHNREYLENGRENIIDSYCALLAAVELFRTTKEDYYLSKASERANELILLYSQKGYWITEKGLRRPFYHASDAGLPIVSLIEYLKIETNKKKVAEVEKLIKKTLTDLLEISKNFEENPFSYAKQVIPSDDNSIKTAFFMPHQNETGYWWQGENARLASIASAIYGSCKIFKEDNKKWIDLKALADSQLNWILGLNPFDICMLQGHGRNNPAYEEDKQNAPGGICNGITAGFFDESDISFLPTEVEGRGDHRWRWSEQWLPHAAWFIYALSLQSIDINE